MRPKPRPDYKGQRASVCLDLPKSLFIELRDEAQDNQENLGLLIQKILERRQVIKDLHHIIEK